MDTKNHYFILTIISVMFFAALLVAPSQASVPNPESTYGWIEYLFLQGETDQTIHEGLKFIYFHPTHRNSDQVRMFIGKSYFKNTEYEKAAEIFTGIAKGGSKQEIREDAALWVCNSLLEQGDLLGARRRCDEFLSGYPESSIRDRILYQKAWSYLKDWKWESAEDTFGRIDSDSDIYASSQEMIKETQILRQQKEKSPLAAGLLSGVLPGSGYIYAAKWQTGIAAFIVNGIFIGASIEAFDQDLPVLASIIGLFELGWYSGTIYGSVNSARQYNYKMREEKLQSLNQRFTIPILRMNF